MADRTVLVNLKANVAQFKSSMADASGSMAKFDKAQAESQAKAQKWQAVGQASTIAGAAVATGLAYAAKAASDQEQAMGALEAVFKTNTAAMRENAEQAVNIGLSQSQYANSAAKLGAQLGNLGMDQGQLAGTTDDLITKAADMAAQFGGPTSDAVDAISAALRKERDPIERYGIALSDAKIKAEMAATGLDEMGATLSLIEKQMGSSNTLGAAAREFDTVASAAQRARASFENAAADLGTALLPALATIADKAAGVAKAFSDLPGPVQTAATALGVFAAAALLLGPRIASAVTGIANLRASLKGTETAGAGLSSTAAKITAIGTAAVIAIPLITEAFNQVSDGISGAVTSDLSGLEQQIISFARTGTGEVGRFGEEWKGLGQSFAENASVFDQWVKMGPFNGALNSAEGEIQSIDATLAAMVGSGNADAAAAAVERFKTETIAAGGSADDVTGALPQYAAALDTSALAAENAANATDQDSAAKRREADAVRSLINDLQTLIGINLAMQGSSDALIGQTQRLRTAFEANGRAIEGSSRGAVANRGAIMSEIGLIQSLAKAKHDQVLSTTGSEQAATAASNRLTASRINDLRANAIAADASAKQVDAFIKKMLGIPGTKKTGIKLDADKAKRDADDTKKKVDDIPRSHSTNVDSPGARKTQNELDGVKGSANAIPNSENVNVTANTGGAIGALVGVSTQAGAIPNYIPVEVHVSQTGASLGGLIGQLVGGRWGGLQGFAGGGSIANGVVSGPGTGTSDSIGPVMLSNGEYVVRASSVRKYGVGALDRINRGEAPRGFKRGGAVGSFMKWARSQIKSTDTWADDEWLDFNAPRVGGPGLGYQPRQKPKKKKGEKADHYKERLNAWREDRNQAKASFREQVRRERLTAKWEGRREAAANSEAIAEAMRQKAADDQAEREQAAADKVADLQQAKAQLWQQVTDSLREASSFVGGFNARFASHADDVKKLADAEAALAAARVAVNTASPSERAAAEKALAEALQAQTEAATAARTSTASSDSVLAMFRQRAKAAEKYSSDIIALQRRGLSTTILSQLATMSPEDAAQMLAALTGMTAQQIAALNATQGRIDAAALTLGGTVAGAIFDPAIAAARANPNYTVAVEVAPQSITLTLDGKTIATAIANYDRKTGKAK